MATLKNKRDTMAFLKRTCKEIKQPFTIFDLTDDMCGRRHHFPTLPELQHMLSKMAFIKIVGRKKTVTGVATQYVYVGE